MQKCDRFQKYGLGDKPCIFYRHRSWPIAAHSWHVNEELVQMHHILGTFAVEVE